MYSTNKDQNKQQEYHREITLVNLRLKKSRIRVDSFLPTNLPELCQMSPTTIIPTFLPTSSLNTSHLQLNFSSFFGFSRFHRGKRLFGQLWLLICMFFVLTGPVKSFPGFWKYFQRSLIKPNSSVFQSHLKRNRFFPTLFSLSPSTSSSGMKSTYQPLADFDQLSSQQNNNTGLNSNHKDDLTFYESLRQCKDNYISKQINSALDILTDALRLYGPRYVFSSYNGGKDADVIMHLLRAVCAKYEADNKVPCQPTLIYFAIEDEFPEVLQHITVSEKKFHLNIVRYNCGIIEVRKFHIL